MAVAVHGRTNPINSTAMRLEPLGARSPLLDLSDAAVKALICGATCSAKGHVRFTPESGSAWRDHWPKHIGEGTNCHFEIVDNLFIELRSYSAVFSKCALMLQA